MTGLVVVGTDTDHYAVGASFSPLPPELNAPSAPVPAVTFENSGEITASGQGLVVGVTLQNLQGFTNSGRIVAEGTGEGAKVIGLGFTSDGGVMQNDGVIKGDFALMAGVPARQVGWISRFGERLPLPTAGNGEAACPHTGESYVLVDGVCSLVSAPSRL